MADQQPANAAPPALTAAPQVAQNGPPPIAPGAPNPPQNQQQAGQAAGPVPQTSNSAQNPTNSNSTTLGTGTNAGPTQAHFTIPITAAAGEIIITQPASALGGSTPLFKLAPTGNPANASANWVVFGWNMTNVYESVQPTSLTLRAGCANGYTYPVGAADAKPTATSGNGTGGSNNDGDNNNSGDDPSNTFLLPDQDGKIPATQSAVTWDVVQYVAQHPNIPVPEGVCTLQIADDRGFGAARRAGYLSPNEAAVTFAFYTGEAYVPIASGGINCPQCKPNSIMKAYEAHPVAISLWVTLVICILSGVRILFRGTAMARAKQGSKNRVVEIPRVKAVNDCHPVAAVDSEEHCGEKGSG